jgi:hypothetical protein
MYLLLALGLMGLCDQGLTASEITQEKYSFVLCTKQCELNGVTIQYGGHKNFLHFTVIVPQTLQPSQSIGITQEEFGFVGGNKRPALWYCMSISCKQYTNNATIIWTLSQLKLNLGNSETQNGNTEH